MANGATIIRSGGSSFADAMQAAAGNAVQYLIAQQRMRQDQERIDLSRQAQEFAQDYNMLNLATQVAERTPGRTLREYGPGVEDIVRRQLGPEAEVFLDTPVSPKTIKDAMEAELMALEQTDPARYKMILEHGGIKAITDQEGGVAGLELANSVTAGMAGQVSELRRIALGQPDADGKTPTQQEQDIATRTWYQATRVSMGLSPTYIDPMSGTEFESTDHARTALMFLEAYNAAVSGGPDAKDRLFDFAKAAHDDFKDHPDLQARMSIPVWMALYQASFEPAPDGQGSKLDQMYREGAIQQPVYDYMTGFLHTMAGAFAWPLYQSQDPAAEGLRNTLGGAEALGNRYGKEALPMVTKDYMKEYSRVTGLPSGYVSGGFNAMGLLGQKRASGIEFIGGEGGGGAAIPGAGPSGQPRAPGVPHATDPGAQVPFRELTFDQQVNRVADALANNMKPDVLIKAGAPQAAVHRAIAMRKPAADQTAMSVDPTAIKRYALSTNPRQVAASVQSSAQQSGAAPLTPGQAFGAGPKPAAAAANVSPTTIKNLDTHGLSIADPDLLFIIDKESKGDVNAYNPTPVMLNGREEHAFGIGQLIDSNRIKYGRILGIEPDTTDPNEQLQLMRAYINDRYGSVAAARQYWERNKSY